MKSSIRTKLTVTVCTSVILIMLLMLGINTLFLGQYYQNSKQSELESVYEDLSEISGEDADIENSDNIDALNDLCERSNVTILVVNSSGDFIYTYGASDMLRERLISTILGIDTMDDTNVISSGDDYTLQTVEEMVSGDEYLEMFGRLPSGNYFVIRTAFESIKESVSISNRFMILVSIPILVGSIIVSMVISKSYTKPILKLADISKKMSELDFDVKYDEKREDEIGVLGESMNELSGRLETTISELKSANIELKKDIEKKEEIDEMRKEFISNVSHELKTPIALIQGYAEGLKESVNDDPESRDFYCEVIIDEAVKMNHMVRRLLELNQIESGADRLDIERFDIVTVINGILKSTRILAEQKGITVEFEKDEPVYVWADEFKIEEVITNYVSNAINHCDFEKVIRITVENDDAIARVSVFNSGNHIPQEDLENVWVKFFKVDKARTREYGGNGIGLSIVKAIMDSLGRECGVSNVDGGVTFWFELDCTNGGEETGTGRQETTGGGTASGEETAARGNGAAGKKTGNGEGI